MLTIDALFGTLFMQKAAHTRHQKTGGSSALYTSPLWLCGFVLMGPGEIGNLLALLRCRVPADVQLQRALV